MPHRFSLIRARPRMVALLVVAMAWAFLGGHVTAATPPTPTPSPSPTPTTTPTIPLAHIGNAGEIVALSNGNLLFTDIGGLNRTGGKVIVTNFQRQLLWKYKGSLDIPHSAYPMPNGDVLIADTGDNRVIEVNAASQVVWDTDDLGSGHGKLGQGTMSDGKKLDYPNDAKPLPNGDILISCRLQNRVIEITKKGKIVRQISGFLHGQHNPIPMSNGDILISDSGWDRILEVNPQNKIVWQFAGQVDGADILSWPRDAVPLSNGDTLITDSDHDRLVEINHAGKTIRQYTNLTRPYAATVLSNGNILVGDQGYGVVELNQKDQMVWYLNTATKDSGKSHMSTIIRNGSFEKTDPGSTWLLYHWSREDALAYDVPPGKRVSMVRDGHVSKVGAYSARISYHGSSNGIYLGQTVRVTSGYRYRFSGWIKTHDVIACPLCIYGKQSQRGHTAEFELAFNSVTGPPPAAPILPEVTGTTDWTHNSVMFTVPPNVSGLDIHCELRGRGTVWFDGLWLQQLTPKSSNSGRRPNPNRGRS
jgi:hypothetical protein